MDIESLMRLRVLVCVIGGSAHAKWWRTEFLTPAGLRFLERLYPRTNFTAAINATAVAARALHDATIGRGGVYHLFRLPESIERDQRAAADSGLVQSVVSDLAGSLESRDALLGKLGGLSPESARTEAGPQRLGTEDDLRERDRVLGRWAGAYFHAFRNEYRVFPYVEAEKSR